MPNKIPGTVFFVFTHFFNLFFRFFSFFFLLLKVFETGRGVCVRRLYIDRIDACVVL